MKDFIPIIKPDINNLDIEELNNVLRSGMLVQGPEVKKLEDFNSKYLKGKYSIAVSSGTATMHLALIALGIKEGDEVIVPAFSYIATANVVELVGAKPVFVDVDPYTFNIDHSKIEQKITKKTKAIIPVHEFGLPCEILKVVEIAKQYNLKVIEDAACALGAKYNNQHVGTFGDAGSFSLHPRKAITCGEGGVITTNSFALTRKLRTLRSHGYCEESKDYIRAGFNYRITDFQASLVLNQFSRLDQQIKSKRGLIEVYNNNLTSEFQKPIEPMNCYHSYQSYHVVLEERINRNLIIKKLSEKGIGSNYGAQCIPETHYYKKKYRINCSKILPNALKAYNSGLVLPLYNSLKESEIMYVCENLNSLVK
mgnify:CR=1 FL=1|tara:strand:+ start:2198 stop:3298 length:1101 start_codon:yes stop_codon:yes gene_type:complete